MITQDQRWLIISKIFALTNHNSQFPLTWNSTSNQYCKVTDPKKLLTWFLSVFGIVVGIIITLLKLIGIIADTGEERLWIQHILYVLFVLAQTTAVAISYTVFKYVDGFTVLGSQAAMIEENLQIYCK